MVLSVQPSDCPRKIMAQALQKKQSPLAFQLSHPYRPFRLSVPEVLLSFIACFLGVVLMYTLYVPAAMAQSNIQPRQIETKQRTQLNGSVHAVVTKPVHKTPRATTGGIVGLELTITPSAGYPIVAQVFPGTPAASAGLRPGDVLLAVDGKSLKGLDVPSVDMAISDEPGRRIAFRIVSQQQPTPRRIELTVGDPPQGYSW